MQEICAKCKDDIRGGAIFVEGGDSFSFCKTCSHLLESSPTGSVRNFLTRAKVENWVSRNMREARKRREKGEKL